VNSRKTSTAWVREGAPCHFACDEIRSLESQLECKLSGNFPKDKPLREQYLRSRKP
jgi:hypothetical protein